MSGFFDILICAAWFGILSGLVEGVLFLVVQASGRLLNTNSQIVWVAPFFNLGLFLFLGLILVGVGAIFRDWPVRGIAVALFTFLTALDWLVLVLYQRLYDWAIIFFTLLATAAIVFHYTRYPAAYHKLYKRSLPYALGLVVALLLAFRLGARLQERNAASNLPPAAAGAPNVLFIVVDTLRNDHLSMNGYLRQTTPNLDRLAANGVSFQNAFAASSYSLPSHASIMTGKNLFEHGVEWTTPKALIDSPLPTLAEKMQAQGYRTGGFSANLYWVTREEGFERGFIHFEDYFQTLGDFFVRPVYGRLLRNLYEQIFPYRDVIGRRDASDINRSVVDWVAQDPARPFFVFVNYMDVHSPYLPPQPYRSMFSTQPNPGGILNMEQSRQNPPLTPEQLQGEVDAYDGAIAYVDQNLGELVAALKERTYGNLLVVVVSDHGEAFGEHGAFLHGMSLYGVEIQVPVVIYSPGHVPGGLKIQQPVSLTSIFPTILDLSGGIESEASASSASLASLWKDPERASSWPNPLAEIARQDSKPELAPVTHGWLKSLISPEWQYIEHETLAPEIYHRSDDPDQQTNLADQPKMQAILRSFKLELIKMLNRGE